jgi:hypothetical protein
VAGVCVVGMGWMGDRRLASLHRDHEPTNYLPPTAGTSDDDIVRKGLGRSLAAGSLGAHPSAETLAASRIGGDSGWGVDFSRFVAVFARRSRCDLTLLTAGTSDRPRGENQRASRPSVSDHPSSNGQEVPTPFRLDGG